MRENAIYGKSSIRKSTTTQNQTAAELGCNPETASRKMLVGGTAHSGGT